MKPIKVYFIVLFVVLLVVYIRKPIKNKDTITPIKLTKTDSIERQLDSLLRQQDTVEIYYETKTNNYRTMPTPERVRLFAERINRQ